MEKPSAAQNFDSWSSLYEILQWRILAKEGGFKQEVQRLDDVVQESSRQHYLRNRGSTDGKD